MQDRVSEEFATGGVSGGTHILIGSALMIGSAWVLLGYQPDGEDNLVSKLAPIVSPVMFFGGAAEVVYGIVRVVKDWNSGFH
jgi:hypothetical protein